MRPKTVLSLAIATTVSEGGTRLQRTGEHMDHEIDLVSDGDGVAVIGDEAAVERFLAAEGLESRDLGLPRLTSALATGGAASQMTSVIAANSGRWVKLTPDSAKALHTFEAMQGSSAGVSRAVLTQEGKIKQILEFTTGPGALLANPAVLAGAAGIMAQLAMQQTMDEITDYLATIDEKVDDILRGQTDAVVARMIGAGLVIQEAMTIREHGGRVNEVTWSKVQAVPGTIAETQAYALRQLDGIAERLERKKAVGDLAKTARDAESAVREWLAVLARCFQLHDAISVLELDRVLAAAPDDLEAHRLGIHAAREDRRTLIAQSTERLIARMDMAADLANSKVLLHPAASGAVVRSSNAVAATVNDFHELLGVQGDRQSLEARRWSDAASQVRDRALESGAEGVDAAWRRGDEAFTRARLIGGRVSRAVVERAPRRRDADKDADDKS